MKSSGSFPNSSTVFMSSGASGCCLGLDTIGFEVASLLLSLIFASIRLVNQG